MALANPNQPSFTGRAEKKLAAMVSAVSCIYKACCMVQTNLARRPEALLNSPLDRTPSSIERHHPSRGS